MASGQAMDYRQDSGAWARRHNHALVSLARRVWTERCTLDTALAQICETAARTLEVARVNVWRLHATHGVLRCVHAYDRASGEHNPPGFDEAFDAGSEYDRQLDRVRLIHATDVQRDVTLSAADAVLGDYLARHQVSSLLDAPIRSEGELLGVVCHEHVGEPRSWSAEDEAFAASIGDFVAMAYEIQRRRDAERRLRYLELHDPQTNLPNRDHLLEVAHSALRPAHGEEASVAAIHLQLEHDGTGRQDAVVAAAAALRGGLGNEATLARVRDDGFALVPRRPLREAEALDLAGRCVSLVEEAVGDGTTRAAAGIAFSRDLSSPSADMLLRNAELASQRARALGMLNRCEVFDAGRHGELVVRMRLERALREAYEQGQLDLHYQPVVDLRDGRIVGAEALLRWRDDRGGWRPCSEFIDVAERSGLIVPLGRWVLLEACMAAMAWPRADLQLAVNVSARQFEQPGLVADVAQALQVSGLAAERLTLELTETVLLHDADVACETLARLRALGVRIALDDFGTGYSSLARLKRLPIDCLKIDRSFVAGLPGDGRDQAIVCAIAGIGREIGLDVVAEGVETAEQVTALLGCGLTRGQGYHFGAAVPDLALRARLAG
ncbi:MULTISPECIES: GGDEF and EAL domain-containing protein [unclassified Luteimonas]|uniref:putative bifunctional diguanylate cyclase/phosphodiesterase n=1 Tax=unclassified Luteimonas TaxID=2629088 RepID=UPI001603306B|nr:MULTISPECIES: GGDEF and EAL domain-containing protein [unclassified Luteimonas]MBB1473203.1 GGDEF and EAL domain-containing protein [Luteimonas sp. MC1782]MBB6598093.1 GGDEF and EAL domain-containing protein [Luteimonas sp. MC1825]QOC88328.1 GGDEF and EAL domain-containing protein [Luteimonas sp. MC1825]